MAAFNDFPWLRGIEGESARDLITSDASLIRVVSGPGSGKTTCLKRRTQKLIDGDDVDSERIFVGTFTRAVTQELKEALGDDINVSTLHSMARSLLQKNLSPRSNQGLHFLLEFEQDAMLYDVNVSGVFSHIGDIRKLRKELREIQSLRSKRREYANAEFSGAIARWLRRYQSMLISEVVFRCVSAMDSGDIPNGLFDHVVVDEYQDLTPDEHELVEFLWTRNGSFTVLGDDDQSIYGFRFNDRNGLSKFGRSWPNETVKDITFEENRRCGDRILVTANLMMAETGSSKLPMIPKSGRPGQQAFPHWDTIDEELSGLAKYINSKPDETFLVLVPRRFVGNQLAELIGSDAKTFFREETLEHDIAQRAFTAACLLANPDDPVAARVWLGFHGSNHKQANERNAKAVATLPNDLFGKELLAKIAAASVDVTGDGQLSVRNQAKSALCLFERNWGPRDAIENLFCASHAMNETDDEKRRWLEGDLLELREAAMQALNRQESPDLRPVIDSMRFKIATRSPLIDRESDHRVKIMTLHAAKGLEADNVIVVSAVDQLLPGLSLDEDEFDEQKRLLYVAITRAKESLVVSWSRGIRYKHLAQNGGRAQGERVETREAGEKWVITCKSTLLPQGLTDVMPGEKWLRLNT